MLRWRQKNNIVACLRWWADHSVQENNSANFWTWHKKWPIRLECSPPTLQVSIAFPRVFGNDYDFACTLYTLTNECSEFWRCVLFTIALSTVAVISCMLQYRINEHLWTNVLHSNFSRMKYHIRDVRFRRHFLVSCRIFWFDILDHISWLRFYYDGCGWLSYVRFHSRYFIRIVLLWICGNPHRWRILISGSLNLYITE